MPEKDPAEQPVENFEACLDELEKVVKELEAGDLPLERSLALFERGMSLSDACRKQLETAETRVEMARFESLAMKQSGSWTIFSL